MRIKQHNNDDPYLIEIVEDVETEFLKKGFSEVCGTCERGCSPCVFYRCPRIQLTLGDYWNILIVSLSELRKQRKARKAKPDRIYNARGRQ